MRTLMVLAAILLAGCTAHPMYVVEINGRRVLFEEVRSGSIPQGLEVLHFDPSGMKVIGDVPLSVNGMHLTADADGVTIESQRFDVHPDTEFIITANGELKVQLSVPINGSRVTE